MFVCWENCPLHQEEEEAIKRNNTNTKSTLPRKRTERTRRSSYLARTIV
uniref:Uncharacterized protein n=1 Tax=Rhizophora mucronata TaxID=61149 RepID=A0A2P2Q1U3_RHIMU